VTVEVPSTVPTTVPRASVAIASRARVSGPSGAAAKLGMPGSALDSKIRALGIRKERFKGG